MHREAENTDGETPASHPDDPAAETAEGATSHNIFSVDETASYTEKDVTRDFHR